MPISAWTVVSAVGREPHNSRLLIGVELAFHSQSGRAIDRAGPDRDVGVVKPAPEQVAATCGTKAAFRLLGGPEPSQRVPLDPQLPTQDLCCHRVMSNGFSALGTMARNDRSEVTSHFVCHRTAKATALGQAHGFLLWRQGTQSICQTAGRSCANTPSYCALQHAGGIQAGKGLCVRAG
jgi:hypothetical protein